MRARRRCATAERRGPNVSTDHGPQTLMQGWIDFDEAHLAEYRELGPIALFPWAI